MTTGVKTTAESVAPGSVSLQNVSAALPADTSATVTVRSDPDGDGTFEETADPIQLQPGTTAYDVTGLSTASGRFSLVVELSSPSPSATPTVDRIEIGG
jgi:hypothetical protein